MTTSTRPSEQRLPRPAGPPPAPSRWLTIAEAAAYAGIDPSMLRKAVLRNRLGPTKLVGGRVKMIQWKQVIAYQTTLGEMRSHAQVDRRARERAEPSFTTGVTCLADAIERDVRYGVLAKPSHEGVFGLSEARARFDVLTLTTALALALTRLHQVAPTPRTSQTPPVPPVSAAAHEEDA